MPRTRNESRPTTEEQIVDPSDQEDKDLSVDIRYTVSSYGIDYDVDGLVKRFEKGDITIPDFQRKFVWSAVQASRFVESLLLGLPVPGIFLYKDPATNKMSVIDGQQRIMSLVFFHRGVIEGKEFALNGVAKSLGGLTYRKLTEEDRRRLDDSVIHATIVRQEDPQDNSSIYLVFERLNTNGSPLSPQEIRACISNGPFIDALEELNQNKHWRTIYGPESKRAKDQEMILRFLALHYELDSYNRPMKLFLDDFIERNRKLTLYDRKKIDSVFEKTIAFAATHLGPESFRPERALNASVVDAFLVATARRLAKEEVRDPGVYKKNAQELLRSEDFLEKCEVGTTSKENVQGRIEIATRAFDAVR